MIIFVKLNDKKMAYIDWTEAKKRGGNRKNIEDPQKMWDLACDYFKHTDDNQYEKQDFIRGGEKAGDIVKLKNGRPYTWAGFAVYLRNNEIISSIDHYRLNRDGKYRHFQEVMKAIGDVIYDNKFSGAAVGVFNANLIARDLGLVDKVQEVVPEAPELDLSKLSEAALEEVLALQSDNTSS